MKRHRMVVSWDRAERLWKFDDVARYELKTDAIEHGRAICRLLWQRDGKLAQLVVKNKNGRIAFENTYGADPRRRKG